MRRGCRRRPQCALGLGASEKQAYASTLSSFRAVVHSYFCMEPGRPRTPDGAFNLHAANCPDQVSSKCGLSPHTDSWHRPQSALHCQASTENVHDRMRRPTTPGVPVSAPCMVGATAHAKPVQGCEIGSHRRPLSGHTGVPASRHIQSGWSLGPQRVTTPSCAKTLVLNARMSFCPAHNASLHPATTLAATRLDLEAAMPRQFPRARRRPDGTRRRTSGELQQRQANRPAASTPRPTDTWTDQQWRDWNSWSGWIEWSDGADNQQEDWESSAVVVSDSDRTHALEDSDAPTPPPGAASYTGAWYPDNGLEVGCCISCLPGTQSTHRQACDCTCRACRALKLPRSHHTEPPTQRSLCIHQAGEHVLFFTHSLLGLCQTPADVEQFDQEGLYWRPMHPANTLQPAPRRYHSRSRQALE